MWEDVISVDSEPEDFIPLVSADVDTDDDNSNSTISKEGRRTSKMRKSKSRKGLRSALVRPFLRNKKSQGHRQHDAQHDDERDGYSPRWNVLENTHDDANDWGPSENHPEYADILVKDQPVMQFAPNQGEQGIVYTYSI